jgi:hypothetical protein
MTAPAIRVDLLIFIRECRLKGPAMQIQLNDESLGKRSLRQIGEEEFIDDACPRDAHRTLLEAFGVGSHHYATHYALRAYRHLRAVVEATYRLAFRALLDLIGGQMQTRLDERVIEYGVVFAAGDKGEVGHICKHRPGAILPVEPQQGTRLWKLVRAEIARNRPECLAQFLPVAPVASIAKRAEPLIAMSLSNHCARAHDLPTFAPGVARGTDPI